MNSSIQIISVFNLSLAFIPVIAVIVIHYLWSQGYKNSIYAISRMLVQLLMIGYFLSYIFESKNGLIVITVVAVMIIVASWISLRTIRNKQLLLYPKAFISLLIGGGMTLILVTQFVLDLKPWYLPSYFVPLAGMIFANAMNSVSLAADRLEAEIDRCVNYEQARNVAFRASLIPIINSLFAVGLVSIPGMMTGQILSGVSPLIAARYQIMVMCMVFSAAGISSACYLTLVKSEVTQQKRLMSV